MIYNIIYHISNRLFDPFVLSLIAFTAFIYYSTSTYDQLKKMNIPHPRPVPLFGNLFRMSMCMENLADAINRIYQQFPDAKICGFYQMKTSYLMIRDPELIDRITNKDFWNFPDRGIKLDPTINTVASGLFFETGRKWKIARKNLNPAFTSSKLKGMHHQINECSDMFMKCLNEKSKRSNEVEVSETVEKFTTDVIGTCAFGLKLETITEDDSDFRKYLKLIMCPLNIRQVVIYFMGTAFPNVVKYLNLKLVPVKAIDFFNSVFTEVVEYRTKHNLVRQDLAQSLIQMRQELVLDGNESHGDEKFTDADIIAKALELFAAASDTTGITGAFCLYELALNRDVQNKLRKEINSTIEKNGGQFTHEFLMDLEYASMVIDETNRKYSIGVALFREATRDYEVPNNESIKIKKGQNIVIPMYCIHNDPKYYRKPEIFDPERFTKEEKSKRPKSHFFPFGLGHRQCIGKRMAELELKLMLSKILTKYEILPCAKTEIPIKLVEKPGLIQSKNGIWLNFKPITNQNL